MMMVMTSGISDIKIDAVQDCFDKMSYTQTPAIQNQALLCLGLLTHSGKHLDEAVSKFLTPLRAKKYDEREYAPFQKAVVRTW